MPLLNGQAQFLGHIAMDCWVKNLWSFVHLADIQLLLATPCVPLVQRQNDAFIMDWEALLHLPAQELAAFNHCRIAHKVIFLSDIMDGGGHSLRDSLLLPPAPPPSSTWLWPHAATVQTDWKIWQHLLPQLAATTVLGDWIQAPHLKVFIPFEPTSNTAYVLRPGQFWQTFRPRNPHAARWQKTLFKSAIALELPPPTPSPVSNAGLGIISSSPATPPFNWLPLRSPGIRLY